QDNWVTGIVILIGIAINTRIGAVMALMGSTLAVATAVFYGAHDAAIRTGMPVLTSAFVFVTWLMLLARNGFPGLIPVAPADAITPEENLARYRVRQKH